MQLDLLTLSARRPFDSAFIHSKCGRGFPGDKHRTVLLSPTYSSSGEAGSILTDKGSATTELKIQTNF